MSQPVRAFSDLHIYIIRAQHDHITPAAHARGVITVNRGIDSIDYAGIGNAPSHIQTLLIMPYGVMEKMESTSIPALFQPVQWFYCGKPGQ